MSKKAKKQPPLRGDLSIDNARKNRALFAAQSRRTYAGTQPQTPAHDMRSARRIVFGIYLEMLIFAGSLMERDDKELFSGRFPELALQLDLYQKEYGSMFPEEHRERVLNYIVDMAAGAYDCADAFLDCRAEQRPQLLHLLKQFRNDKVVLEFEGDMPAEMIVGSPGQQSPYRIFGEYYELAYRIVKFDTVTQQREVLVTYRTEGIEANRVFIASQCRRVVQEAATTAQIKPSGIVYKYFPLT